MASPTAKKSDSLPVHIQINHSSRAKMAQALARALADTELLFMKSQYYHWNVTGPTFSSLHILFEKHYNELRAAGDELAERIRALGYMSPGTFREMLQLSDLKEDSSLPSNWKKMVTNLMHDREYCSKHAREVMDLAEKLKDDVTADLLVGHMRAHEMAAWMLRACLEENSLKKISG